MQIRTAVAIHIEARIRDKYKATMPEKKTKNFCVGYMLNHNYGYRSETRPTRESSLRRERSDSRTDSRSSSRMRPVTALTSNSAMYNASIRQRLVSALADNRDLNMQLIGLKKVVEEFIVRLDFMLKCRESPEACLNDLRQLSDDLDVLVQDCCNEEQGCRTDSAYQMRQLCALEHENRKLKEMVSFLEGERAELRESVRKSSQLESLLADAQKKLAEKDGELSELSLRHETELKRIRSVQNEEVSELKKSIAASNRIIERWKNIYHEDMMRMHSRARSPTVNTRTTS